MGPNGRSQGPILLVEPDINAVSRRFGLPAVANYPPLAQVRLAGQIRDPFVRVVDLRIPRERKQFERLLRDTQPALVGISLTFTSNGDEAIRVAETVRRLSPGTVIVMGGTGASEDPGAFFDSKVDFIAFRHGDLSLARLVTELRTAPGKPPRAPGFYHRESGGWVLEPDDSEPLAMEALRPYAWQALPAYYWKHYYQGYRPTGIGQMSEGCPFDCTFCSVWKVHGRSVNVASLANVQHDLRSLPRFVRAFFFADDIWMQATEAQLQSLHDPLLAWLAGDFLPRRRDLWLTAETRTDLFLRHEARFRAWAKDGNLMRILFGVEAVTDPQLDAYSKRTTVDVNSDAIRRAHGWGIFVTAQFVIPCDADRSYFDELARFLESHREYIDVSNFTIATPLPGTDLYTDVLKQHPELADRSVVTHPAFSLFTALAPTRMEPREFYDQVARVHRVANQFQLDWNALENLGRLAIRSPWLLPNVLKLPSHLKNLTSADMFLHTHREVQGERLLA